MSGQISFSMILLSLNGTDRRLCSDNSTKIIGMFRPFSFLVFTFHLIIFLIWWVLLAICSKAIWLHFLTGYVFKLFSLFVCYFKHWEISAFSENQLCFLFYFTKVCIFFFPFIFISWRLITSQHFSGFCHTLTWISHGVTCIPYPDPPSHLPLHWIPLGLPSAPGPSTCLMHLSIKNALENFLLIFRVQRNYNTCITKQKNNHII